MRSFYIKKKGKSTYIENFKISSGNKICNRNLSLKRFQKKKTTTRNKYKKI